jgi:hypothetical protein
VNSALGGHDDFDPAGLGGCRLRFRCRVAAVALLAAACAGTAQPKAPPGSQAPVPVPGRVQIDGPGSFGPRIGDRVAVIVDGLRVGRATCDSSRQLVLAEGADRALRHEADIASVALVMGASAARAYELRGGEVGALVITTRRPPNETLHRTSADGRPREHMAR